MCPDVGRLGPASSPPSVPAKRETSRNRPCARSLAKAAARSCAERMRKSCPRRRARGWKRSKKSGDFSTWGSNCSADFRRFSASRAATAFARASRFSARAACCCVLSRRSSWNFSSASSGGQSPGKRFNTKSRKFGALSDASDDADEDSAADGAFEGERSSDLLGDSSSDEAVHDGGRRRDGAAEEPRRRVGEGRALQCSGERSRPRF
mmetsp:Transcript_33633/g.96579  ORF Transcript_33633/g.96579 Transcript_33633/m.96579 type:complete len:208 (+) Transcript_33633:1187-1810(+)